MGCATAVWVLSLLLVPCVPGGLQAEGTVPFTYSCLLSIPLHSSNLKAWVLSGRGIAASRSWPYLLRLKMKSCDLDWWLAWLKLHVGA